MNSEMIWQLSIVWWMCGFFLAAVAVTAVIEALASRGASRRTRLFPSTRFIWVLGKEDPRKATAG